MYTQCPYCLTLFRVRAEQLRAAGGQVHCGRCNQIFNALHSLSDSSFQETPASEHRDGLSQGLPPYPANGEGEPNDDVENVSLSQLFKDSMADDALVQHYGNPATAPDAEARPPQDTDRSEAPVPRKTDEQRESGQTAKPLFESRSEPSGTAPPDTDEDTIEDNLDDIPLAGGENPAAPKHSAAATLGWTLGILLLLAGALAQFSWLERDRLQHYPGAREAFERVCALVGCRLEPQRDPDRIKILDRSVTSHPNVADALQILLIFSNKAAFPQPYPKLRLGLYSTNNQLVAQRLFNPSEYLADANSEHSLLKPDQQVRVEMALEDPGDKVTGFRFDFF